MGLGLASALLASACQPGASLPDRRRDTDALATVFPALESLHVVAFRDQDWCRNIAYRGGRFSTKPESAACNLFSGAPAVMPDTPSGDPGFARVRDALRRAQSRGGPGVRYFNASYGADGRLASASFTLDCPWPFCRGRVRYDYAPVGPPPDATSGRATVLPAGPRWTLVREDG